MAVRTVSPSLAQLPNALTIARLLVIPVFTALVLAADGGRSWPAAILFGAAAITDQVDGFLARRWHVESAFGKIADPLADRVLIDVAVLLLWHAGRLPWLALAIPLRDVLLVFATPFAVARGYRFEVNLLGKAATWLLYSSLAFTLVTSGGTAWPRWLFWAGLAVALASLVFYARKARIEVST
jgi:CDP-diacylglycerol--glycerol-3-phosphate 3-phosphatidyltransferase